MSQLSLIPSDIVIYHENCTDGTMAAWCAKKKLGPGCQLIKAQYGDRPPPDTIGNNLFILDFSYKRRDMEILKEQARNLVVLDHHETARADLEGLEGIHIDISKSGARLAWDYFFPGQDPPDMVLYVEDSDLWKFSLKDSKAHRAFMSTVRKTIGDYETAMSIPLERQIQLGHEELVKINDYVHKQTGRAFLVKMDGYEVYACPAERYISEIGNVLCRDRAFSVTWFVNETAKEKRYSLRSDENGIDVSLVAAKLGGGGHKHAAGFSTSLEEWPWKN